MANNYNKKLKTNSWNMPQQYGDYRANPKKNSNNLILWMVLNSALIFFCVTILFENAIIESIALALNFLTFKYVSQLLLFLIILALDLLIIFVIKDLDVLNAGVITLMIYFALDYYYLSKEYTQFSLLNLDLFN